MIPILYSLTSPNNPCPTRWRRAEMLTAREDGDWDHNLHSTIQQWYGSHGRQQPSDAYPSVSHLSMLPTISPSSQLLCTSGSIPYAILFKTHSCKDLATKYRMLPITRKLTAGHLHLNSLHCNSHHLDTFNASKLRPKLWWISKPHISTFSLNSCA